MRQITSDRFVELISAQESPCISLYQPTHRQHPDNAQDPIRFRNLLGQLESLLREKYDTKEVRETLKPFEQLATDNEFWNHRTDDPRGIGNLARGFMNFHGRLLDHEEGENVLILDAYSVDIGGRG